MEKPTAKRLVKISKHKTEAMLENVYLDREEEPKTINVKRRGETPSFKLE